MHRPLRLVCALSVLILGILTLVLSTNAKRTFYPMQSSSPINVALAANGAVASASSVHFSGNFPVAAVNNGDRKGLNWGSGGGWNDNTQGDYSSDIVQINFPAFNYVSQINVFTLRDNYPDNQTPPTLTDTFSTCENSGYGITEFEVQYWSGWTWVTVPSGLVRDNNKVWRQLTFPEVWASGIRVQVHGATRFTNMAINYSRIIEIEAYGRTAGFNLAAAANGAVAIASSQADANFPVSAVNDGDRTGFNWTRGGFGSGWKDGTENEYSIDWVRIDFAGGQARRINEIDVYTLRDGFSTKPDDPTIFETFATGDNPGYGITDYDVQYLTSGVWRTVPGGKVTNNNKVRCQFRFSPITTSAIRAAVHKGANSSSNWSRIVEIEAWENPTAPDDVVWVEDALPAGAVPAGAFEGWNWTCLNPAPLSVVLAHTSEVVAGVHQHYFYNATQTLTVNAGDTLFAHVYLDPANPPTSVMLQWNDGAWEHRAYWGENQFPWGVDGTVSRRNMGVLPPAGQWVRLEAPASLVGLEGRTLNGMAFSLVNGRATWDHAGKYAGAAVVQPAISISDVTVNEGNSGTTTAMFNVTLSSASTQPINVNYTTANGTAINPSDYAGASGTVTFAPGQTSRQISIQVVGDTVAEANENFFINLSTPVNATLADNQGAGTIVNLSYFPIPVYFHVIQNTDGIGNLPDSTLDAQIDVLNNAFNGAAGANVQFFFWRADVTRDTNNYWFEMESISDQYESGAELQAKRMRRQGGANALNLYTAHGGPPPEGSQYRYGWSSLPRDYATMACRDGVVVPFDTLPGVNPNSPYNEGELPVHEVGHWLGLFHTFSYESCALADDQVADTPAHLIEVGNIGGCPTNSPDTCPDPGQPVVDPINNYMTDYSDLCKSQFTRGQFERMRDQYMAFRQSNTTAPECPIITMSINNATTVNEGNSGLTAAVFTVTLSRPSTQRIVVRFDTADGTATSGSDYFSGAGGTLSFDPGQISQSFSINVIGDTLGEPNETFFVNLSNPQNALLGVVSQGVGTIVNDDAAAPVYEGWVDIADCNSIIGWAADRNRLNTSITVGIYDGNTLITSIPAGDLRSDVGAYLGDNGRHGFAISTPQHFKDGLPHTLRVKFESSTTELGGSPKTIACSTYYEIVARHSSKCLDVEGESMASGARVIQFVCGGWANQQWQIIPVGGGYYKIVARHSGKVLDVQWGAFDNGTPVWQWDENGTAAQQWEIIDVGGGYVGIIARHSGKALDVAGGSFADLTQIHQWDYVGVANQQWLLRPVP